MTPTAFSQYQDAARAECISLLGCAVADDSLHQLGDKTFHALVRDSYRQRVPPAEVALKWQHFTSTNPTQIEIIGTCRVVKNRLSLPQFRRLP